MTDLFRKVLAEFEQITTFKPQLTSEYTSALADLCRFLESKPLRCTRERTRRLLANINRKFRLNRTPVAAVYAAAAKYDITFNYHEKESIQQAFDLSDGATFVRILQEKGVDSLLKKTLIEQFRPVSPRRDDQSLCE